MRTNKARGIVFPIQPTLRNQGELLNLNWMWEGKRESLGKYHEALKPLWPGSFINGFQCVFPVEKLRAESPGDSLWPQSLCRTWHIPPGKGAWQLGGLSGF